MKTPIYLVKANTRRVSGGKLIAMENRSVIGIYRKKSAAYDRCQKEWQEIIDDLRLSELPIWGSRGGREMLECLGINPEKKEEELSREEKANFLFYIGIPPLVEEEELIGEGMIEIGYKEESDCGYFPISDGEIDSSTPSPICENLIVDWDSEGNVRALELLFVSKTPWEDFMLAAYEYIGDRAHPWDDFRISLSSLKLSIREAEYKKEEETK